MAGLPFLSVNDSFSILARPSVSALHQMAGANQFGVSVEYDEVRLRFDVR